MDEVSTQYALTPILEGEEGEVWRNLLALHALVISHYASRDNNIEECGLEMFFACDFDTLGVIKSHELVEGGATKMVTEQNKVEYIELVSSGGVVKGWNCGGHS